MIRKVMRDKETKTIKIAIERAPGDVAVCVLHTPYRLQLCNKIKAAARFVRTGYCWGGYI